MPLIDNTAIVAALQALDTSIARRAAALADQRCTRIADLSGGAVMPDSAQHQLIQANAALELEAEFAEYVRDAAIAYGIKLDASGA